MTAWQDQPPLISKPLSRRQARENERGEGSSGPLATAQQVPDGPAAASIENNSVLPPVEERTFTRRELRAMETDSSSSLVKPEALDPSAQSSDAHDSERGTSAVSAPSTNPAVEPDQPLRRNRNRQLSTDQSFNSAAVQAESDARLEAEKSAPKKLFVVPPLVETELSPASTAEGDVGTVQAEQSTRTPPTGHWSTQAMIDDDEQTQANTLSRNIAETSGAVTANALVLPALPVGDLTRPLGSTGEILITGTIDLPRSYGETGAVPARYDHSDVDTLLEASDREDAEANPGSAPVSALNAVNTNTSTLGAMDLKKSKSGSRLPLILGIVAGVVVAGIIVLVVAAIVFGVFK